jgi:hypothetical protein
LSSAVGWELALTAAAENSSKRVDLQLESDKEEDDESDDDENSEAEDDDEEEDDSGDTNGDAPESRNEETSLLVEHPPTIQIQFAVGNLDKNPMMKILAPSDSDESDDDGSTSEEDEDEPRKRAVEDLLSHDGTYESPKKQKKTQPLIIDLS